jgi:hypothetical protein
MEQKGNPGAVKPEQQGGDRQQKLYDTFVGKGIVMAQAAAKKLKGQEPNPETIANIMVDIGTRIENEGKQHGVEFDLAVKMHGGQNILEALLKMSGMNLPEEQYREVVGRMVGKYLNNAVRSGSMTKEQVAELGQQAQQSGQVQAPAGNQQGILGAQNA